MIIENAPWQLRHLERTKTDVYASVQKGNLSKLEEKFVSRQKAQEKQARNTDNILPTLLLLPTSEIGRNKKMNNSDKEENGIKSRGTQLKKAIRGPSSPVLPGENEQSVKIRTLRPVQKFEQTESQKKKEKKENAIFRRRRSNALRKKRYPESPPHFRFTPIDQTVSPSSPVSLKCSSVGVPVPIISWTRDGEPLIPSYRIRVGSFRDNKGGVVSYVNISDVTARDGGLFRCTAHNAAGMATHASRLNVYGSPFVRPMANISAVAGEDTALWCPAGGFPVPTISWQFMSQSLPRSLRHEILSNNTLVVRDVKEMDKGRYTCIASGRGGQTAMADTYLNIINPPIIEEFAFSQNLKEGRRTQLSCMVTSGDVPITIQWLKNGHHLPHDSTVEQKKISEYSMILLFKNLSERHSGKYSCVASNSAGSYNHTAELKVKVPPKWVLSPSDLSVSVAGSIKLDCMARGVPDPVITWSKSTDEELRDFQLIIDDGHRIDISTNGTLSISNVQKSDAATYLCKATNEVGSPISKIASITVSARPEITSTGGRVTGHSGRSVKLECETRGDAPMVVNWRRDGHHIMSDSQRIAITKFDLNGDSVRSVLSINEIRQTDAGTYVCEAANNHGRKSKSFDLVVLELPSAPSNLKVEEVFSRSVRLSWVTLRSVAVTIQLKKGEDGSWSERGKNISISRGEINHDLSSLSPFTKYYVRLFAVNELGASSPSEVIGFVTQEEAPSGSPRNIRVTSVESGTLEVSWTSPPPGTVNGIIRGYVISLRKQNIREDFRYITRPASSHVSKSSREEYLIRGLSPNTLYEVAMKVFNRVGEGPLSSPRIVQETMFEAPGCPSSGVSCKGDSLAGIRVWWESPLMSCANAPITGYSILATPVEVLDNDHSGSFTQEIFTTNLEKNLEMMPPSSNISVIVRAYNNFGFSPPSRNVFCYTLDGAPSSPERLRVVPAEAGSFVAVWLPPTRGQGVILRYTLYYEYGDKVSHILVPNNDVDSSWKKLSGFQLRERIKVWVTASTSAGEGPPSSKVSLTLRASSSYGPFVLSSQSVWKVSENSAVTLRCRGIGMPRPSISWHRDGRTLTDDRRHQTLPGGDLHLIPQSSAQYSCYSSNSAGEDSITHSVVVLSTPSKPILRVNEAYQTSLNMSVSCHDDRGAPILGYRLHQRYENGEWQERPVAITTSNAATNFILRNLPCGSTVHLYATAWNSQGISTPSEVLVTSTKGALPLRPQPSTLVEINSTCVTLRLYAWPENDCPVQHWKVEGKHENANEWKTIFSKVGKESRDIGFCDLQRTEAYLLKIIATSEAGPTKVTYKVSLQDTYSGWATSEHIQEIMIGSEKFMNSWFDPHIVAGIVSAILLSAAVVICSCVVFRKRYFERDRITTPLKEKESIRLAHHGNDMADYHVYSPLPSKKAKALLSPSNIKRKRSRPTLVSYRGPDEGVLTTEDLYPYATFSAGSMDETLQYGISLHAHSPSSRDCFEGAERTCEGVYGSRKERIRSHYNDSDINYRPAKMVQNEMAGKPRPTSTIPSDHVETDREMSKLSEVATMQISERSLLGKEQRPRSRIQKILSPIPQEERSNKNSPSHRSYAHSVPVQTLYGSQAKNEAKSEPGGSREPIPIPSGQHARGTPEGSISSPDSCGSGVSLVSRPLNPPSAFSDSREPSEAECDREVTLRQTQKTPCKLKHETATKIRHRKT